jgi:hypothetical protein
MFSLCKKISSVLVNPFFLNMQRGLKLCKITEMFLFFFLILTCTFKNDTPNAFYDLLKDELE